MTKKASQVSNKLNMGGTNVLITIYHHESHSWQGSIQWIDTGKKLHFRSELELINLIQSAIQTSQRCTTQLRTWINN